MTLKLSRSQHLLLLAVPILVIIFFSRLRWHDQDMHGDEIWSIWQTQGDIAQVIAWTPYDWNPLYFVVLHGWSALTGDSPLGLRVLPALLACVAGAMIVAIARRTSPHSAVMSLLVYGALGYVIFIGFEIRAYAMLWMLALLGIWLALRYFDQPGIRRAAALALVLAACVAVQATALAYCLLLGIFTLVMYPRRIWRWWLPVVMAAPLGLVVFRQGGETLKRFESYNAASLPPVLDYVLDLFAFHTGSEPAVWLLLVLLALVGIYRQRQRWSQHLLAWGVWCAAAAMLFYLLMPVFNTGVSRHSWWWAIGAVMLLGAGLGGLPRIGQMAAGVSLLAMMFAPIPIERYSLQPWPNPVLGASLAELARHSRWGDVIVLDDNQSCSPMESEWQYYIRQYFPQGIRMVRTPPADGRVWFVTSNGWQDGEVEARIQQGRERSIFFGEPRCVFQLYEAPPDSVGIAFDNGLRFHGADVIENGVPSASVLVARREGEQITLRLWWSVDAALPLDYSVSVVTIPQEAATSLPNTDGSPQLVRLFFYDERPHPSETSQWQPGRFYIQEVTLQLPTEVTRNNGRNDYAVCAAVYYWETLERLAYENADADRCLPLIDFVILSW